MAQRAFVLGWGQIGRAIAANFIANGWTVTIGQKSVPSNCDQDGLERFAFDREDTAAIARAIGDGFDAVVDTVAFGADHAAQWAGLSDRLGKLVVISSISVYADDQGRTLDEARQNGFPHFANPIPETNRRTAAGPETYSTRKVALEDAIMALDLPTVILRPGAIYGVGCRSPREWWFVQRVLAGHVEIPIAWSGKSRFHPVAAGNLAELTRLAIETGGSHVLNAVDADCPTVLELGRMILDAISSAATLNPFDGPPRGLEGATPWSIPLPMIADMTAAEQLGYRPVTHFAKEMPLVCSDLIERAKHDGWKLAFPGLALYPTGYFLD
jgi:nucleoside-diphosphate-sugar epimerase